jgi:hypothetical protein
MAWHQRCSWCSARVHENVFAGPQLIDRQKAEFGARSTASHKRADERAAASAFAATLVAAAAGIAAIYALVPAPTVQRSASFCRFPDNWTDYETKLGGACVDHSAYDGGGVALETSGGRRGRWRRSALPHAATVHGFRRTLNGRARAGRAE